MSRICSDVYYDLGLLFQLSHARTITSPVPTGDVFQSHGTATGRTTVGTTQMRRQFVVRFWTSLTHWVEIKAQSQKLQYLLIVIFVKCWNVQYIDIYIFFFFLWLLGWSKEVFGLVFMNSHSSTFDSCLCFHWFSDFPSCDPLSQFSCSSGKCISMKWHCDSGKSLYSTILCKGWGVAVLFFHHFLINGWMSRMLSQSCSYKAYTHFRGNWFTRHIHRWDDDLLYTHLKQARDINLVRSSQQILFKQSYFPLIHLMNNVFLQWVMYFQSSSYE